MSDARRYRVLIRSERYRLEGATKVYADSWEDVTEAQAVAYALGDPDWRCAGESPSSLLERLGSWLRWR